MLLQDDLGGFVHVGAVRRIQEEPLRSVEALYKTKWSAAGDVILAGAPWQAWRAPSWEEIAAAEAKEKTRLKQP